MPATTSLAFKTRMTPTLSILMVNYKTRDLTLASLRTVFAETSATDFELILVDNDSGDGSFGSSSCCSTRTQKCSTGPLIT